MSLLEPAEAAAASSCEHVVIESELDIHVVRSTSGQGPEWCRIFDGFQGGIVSNRYPGRMLQAQVRQFATFVDFENDDHAFALVPLGREPEHA